MSPTNQDTRAYVIEAAPETLDNIASKLLPISDNDAFFAIHNAQPLDTDALRLVLEASMERYEMRCEECNDPRTLCDETDRRNADALGDAIAKLEAII